MVTSKKSYVSWISNAELVNRKRVIDGTYENDGKPRKAGYYKATNTFNEEYVLENGFACEKHFVFVRVYTQTCKYKEVR